MRAYHVMAVVVVLVVGFGASQSFSSPVKAGAGPAKAEQIMNLRTLMETIDVKALPRQDILSEADE